MAVKRGLLLLITLFLASASLSLAYSRSERELTEKLDQCLDRCQSRSDSQRMLICQGQCAHDYFKERQEFEDEDNTSSRTEQGRFEQCERQCEFEPRGQQQRDCKRRCERQQESFSPRKFEECERECEMEPRGQPQRECQRRCQRQQERFSPRKLEECERECELEPRGQPQRECQRRCQRFDPEERQRQSRVDRYKRCQRRCSEMGILQQVPCQTRCAAEFGLRDVDDNRRPTSPRECERECEFEPRRKQGQCLSRCQGGREVPRRAEQA